MKWSLILAAVLTMGQAGPPLPPTDPHIRIVAYDANQLVRLNVSEGFAAVVELGSDESVESVVVGNSAAWQVTASRRGDSVIVKPLAGAVTTDMVIITGARRYVFALEPSDAGTPALYVVRFSYPGGAASSALPTAPVATFKFRGARALFPASMYDDGRRTIVTWSVGTFLPAIFAVAQGGREAIVNGRMVAGDYVVEGTASRFVFRLGNEQAIATRHAIGRK